MMNSPAVAPGGSAGDPPHGPRHDLITQGGYKKYCRKRRVMPAKRQQSRSDSVPSKRASRKSTTSHKSQQFKHEDSLTSFKRVWTMICKEEGLSPIPETEKFENTSAYDRSDFDFKKLFAESNMNKDRLESRDVVVCVERDKPLGGNVTSVQIKGMNHVEHSITLIPRPLHNRNRFPFRRFLERPACVCYFEDRETVFFNRMSQAEETVVSGHALLITRQGVEPMGGFFQFVNQANVHLPRIRL
ncbi:hypothetical protein AAG570_010996 [Ranatra chinensis]|uniref:Uncharacterized protein n=1 Tax=Ranatra chinensis TaxID=642074 RepID=A0ABD0YJM1_9HEMI